MYAAEDLWYIVSYPHLNSEVLLFICYYLKEPLRISMSSYGHATMQHPTNGYLTVQQYESLETTYQPAVMENVKI